MKLVAELPKQVLQSIVEIDIRRGHLTVARKECHAALAV
jgi:hypothetical protein